MDKIANAYGKLVPVKIKKYQINWDGKSKSKLQYNVKQFFKPFWKTHTVLEEYTIPSSRLMVDFINLSKKIAVEVHGRQHDDFVEHFHVNRSGFLNSWRRDKEKREWVEMAGLTFIEIYEADIKDLSRKFFLDKYDIDIV